MADKISKEQLLKEITEILKDADLDTMSSKKVRLTLEKKLKVDLTSRKDEIGKMIMDYVASKSDAEESDDDEDDEEEEDVKPTKKPAAGKRAAPPPKKATVTKKKKQSDSEESEEEELEDDDFKPKRAAKKPAKKAAGGGGKAKSTGFTRPYKLSPELSELMGADSLPRHEVVKKVWAMIKERNLYDPKNKQYAICDPDLHKVMGIKRFRTFGMLKYLKTHFIE